MKQVRPFQHLVLWAVDRTRNMQGTRRTVKHYFPSTVWCAMHFPHRKSVPPRATARSKAGGIRLSGRRFRLPDKRRVVATVSAFVIPSALIVQMGGVAPSNAAGATVGQGFTVTASDLSYILKQIKIAENHVDKTTSATGPCGALLGTGPNQLSSPLLSFGPRTVDGSCNNLVEGKEFVGAADQVFPRLTTPDFKAAESQPPLFRPPSPSSYAQKSGNVFDTEPRVVSNLIVDQTSTNPAAIRAAGFPVRTQGNPGVVPCTQDPDPLADPPVPAVPTECTPSHETLFIPNVTTDVGLSPPYNSLFTLFGQFFDHGVDLTQKSGGTVFVPLKADDPLIAGPDHIAGNADDLPAERRFMVLTRAKNQPGQDGVLGTADDEQNATNLDTPWVDQSQTYTSHSAHQVFLREYVNNTAGKPVANGKMLRGDDGGMATWAKVKSQAATMLGFKLEDTDVANVPLVAADQYGRFLRGPNGFPQVVTPTSTVEGNPAAPVALPANVRRINHAFLDDIAHHAVPTGDKDG